MDFLTFKSFIRTEVLIIFYYLGALLLPIDQLQMITDHQRRESFRKYAVVTLDEKRRLMEGKQGENCPLSTQVRLGTPNVWTCLYPCLFLAHRDHVHFLML
jgi:hypothetical protein